MEIVIPEFSPVSKRIDLISTPVAVYKKLYHEEKFSFLYESLESIGKRGRYSFIGAKPFIIFSSQREDIEIKSINKTYRIKGNPIEILRKLVTGYKSSLKISSFSGGAVGYISYDAVRFFEKIPDTNPDELSTPDTFFIFPEEIIIFDHKEKTIDIILYSEDGGEKRIEELVSSIKASSKDTVMVLPPVKIFGFKSNFTKESFCKIVKKAREYIFAGDIFQVVLSQRFKFHIVGNSFTVYQRLRETNPSPYMYFLKFDDLSVLGSSPEILVKLTDDVVVTRPLAGTCPRGETDEEDVVLAAELTADEKERAEHIMLVDLARNDIGRVCVKGSIKVTELFGIEKYSRVMHLVSNVVGRLQKGKDAFDLMSSTFPAGTVSGAPKIRAMEIIDELEPVKRGIYAGAIGYFAFSGNMDFCIAIRMILIKDKIGIIQAGAGIVADSDPMKEYQETLNKAKALLTVFETEEK